MRTCARKRIPFGARPGGPWGCRKDDKIWVLECGRSLISGVYRDRGRSVGRGHSATPHLPRPQNKYKAQEISDSDGTPVLLMHLPEYEKVVQKAAFARDNVGLKKALGERPEARSYRLYGRHRGRYGSLCQRENC